MRWLYLLFATAVVGCSSDPSVVVETPSETSTVPERQYSSGPPEGRGYNPCTPAGSVLLADEHGNLTEVYFDGYCAENGFRSPISDPPIDDNGNEGPLPEEQVDIPRPKPGDPVP